MRGKRRKKVLYSLKEAKTPKQIAEECKISISNISVALAELVEKGLIRCITPKERIFRFYEITNKGKKALKQLEEYEKRM